MADFREHQSTTSAKSVNISYDSKPALYYASKVGLQSAMVGLAVSATQNALGNHSRGATGVFTRTGGTIGFFAAMGTLFAWTEATVANYRQKDDALNGVAGGCAAGFLAGIKAKSLPKAIASCAVLGATVGTFDYGGKQLSGRGSEETQEEHRRRFFKQSPS